MHILLHTELIFQEHSEKKEEEPEEGHVRKDAPLVTAKKRKPGQRWTDLGVVGR